MVQKKKKKKKKRCFGKVLRKQQFVYMCVTKKWIIIIFWNVVRLYTVRFNLTCHIIVNLYDLFFSILLFVSVRLSLFLCVLHTHNVRWVQC